MAPRSADSGDVDRQHVPGAVRQYAGLRQNHRDRTSSQAPAVLEKEALSACRESPRLRLKRLRLVEEAALNLATYTGECIG